MDLLIKRVVASGILIVAAILGSSLAQADAARDEQAQSQRFAPAPGQITLDVLTYNVYLRPLMPEWQDVRAPLIAAHLAGYDVVLLQEAFSDWHRGIVLRGLAKAYPYRSRVLGGDRGMRQDGGVVLASRWPIEVEVQRPFGELCAGRDCLADKGVLYVQINKEGLRFHVFATHLQSGRANWDMRRRQLEVLRRLIEEKRLPADEPVLIGGDLNVDRFADAETGDFSAMMRILDASLPAPSHGGAHEATFDPTGNWLAGGEVPRRIDYLLYSNRHLAPAAASTAVRRLFAGNMPLSDHYAVHGRFAFEAPWRTAARPASPPAAKTDHP